MKPLDPEIARLLRAVVRPARDDRESMAFKDLAAGTTRWEETIEGAWQHGVLPVLYSKLLTVQDVIPPDALELARNEFERNAFHCMANSAELLDLLKAFEQALIPAMPFKGVLLGSSAYGDITMRTAGDVDLLIYYRDLIRATAILNDRGYELRTQVLADGSPAETDSFEFHFERSSDGMVVELRWRLELTQPRFRRDLGMDWVWPRRRTAKLAGAEVPNLDAISALLVLCMHGSRHTWSRLIWICDVAKLVESEPGLDWDSARAEARRVGLWRCLALGVLLARRAGGADVPAEVLRDFEADRSARGLADFLNEHVLEEPGRTPNGPVPYHIQLLGFQDRLRLLLSPAFFRPNARDREVLKLPKALEPLYYVIRPFRMLMDRSQR